MEDNNGYGRKRERDERALVEACAEGQTDGRRYPKTGRGGETGDLESTLNEYSANAEEAYPGDDLGRDSHWIGADTEHHYGEISYRCGECRADANENVRAQTCRAPLLSALYSYYASAEGGENKSHEDGY